MRNLAILTFMTLDGVMQAPNSVDEDPTGGFTSGGWARKCWEDVMQQVMQEAMSMPYDLLLGRKTYELFAENFTGTENNNPVATKLTNATKYVVSSTLDSLKWKNSKLITGDIAMEVTRLKNQHGPLLQVHGSWQLIQTLLANDLIDEFRLWTFPVVVGCGKRLFHQSSALENLSLIKTDSCPSGAVMHIYKKG